MRPLFCLLAFLASLSALTAQSTAPKTQAPAKKGSEIEVAGYRTVKMEGFTLLISQDVEKANVTEFKTKPLEVLEGELKTITSVMNARALSGLRKLLIWVEWDESTSLSNGRGGSAVAVYYGGHQLSLLAQGKHPLQAKTVTVLSLRSITREHQPDRTNPRCVLLHEFAHAVHDQVLGMDHPRIKLAYQQAMERKLYDKAQYVSTNPAEFFAELSACYLDKLHYYPQNRDDLKKHDANSYKTLESIWKSSAKAVTAKPKVTGDGSDQFSLSLTFPDSVSFGGHVSGPQVQPSLHANKVVLVAYWGGPQANVLNRLNPLHEELAPYGFTVIAANPYVTPDDVIRKEVTDRGAKYSVVKNAFLSDANPPKNESAPHAILFDNDGKCIFRGSSFKVENFARTAVGQGLLEKLGDEDELGAAFQGITKAITSGQGPLALVPKAQAIALDKDPEVAARGKQFLDLLLAPAAEALEAARTQKDADPWEAYVTAERIIATYARTPVATKANELMTSVRLAKPVLAELAARPTLDRFKKMATTLSAQPGGFNPKDPTFQVRNATSLNQMRVTLDTLRKRHPDTRSTKEAEATSREFGIP